MGASFQKSGRSGKGRWDKPILWENEHMAHESEPSHLLTVGERGRLVIPAALRRALGIGPGSTLIARLEDGGRLVLEDRRAVARRLRGSWGPMPAGRSAVEELLEERSAEAALEDAELAGSPEEIAAARQSLSAIGDRHLPSARRRPPAR
jgi:AbrB family looped-hinge helix DNA binding protein